MLTRSSWQQYLVSRREFIKHLFMALVAVNFQFAGRVLADEATTVDLPAAIREQLSKVVSAQPPQSPLRHISGNLQGGSGTARVERYFERLDSGLWGISTAILVRGALIRNTLTLQGLVELTATTTIDRDFKADVVIPVGKLFLPYGINKNIKANAVITIASLAGDLDSVSAPAAGGKFSYMRTATGQNTITTTGVFGGTRTHTLNVTAKADCSAGPEADASSLHAQLRGKYLPVKCEGDINGSTRIEEYAYLIDSKLYLLLSSGSDKFSIDGVEYGP
jgi:hypothetical protein